MSEDIGFMPADWPAPQAIRAGTTLRMGGISQPPFDSFNLGNHTGDAAPAVSANRARLVQDLALPDEPAWLTQVHGTTVVDAGRSSQERADASVSASSKGVCAVLTADCLPVLFCDVAGSCWGAAHAGWRGLAGGVLEATIGRLEAQPTELMAWLGPAIGPAAFEIGQDVYDVFCNAHPEDAAAFAPGRQTGKYLADLYRLARARLARAGVTVYGGGLCTYSSQERFYSFRRDGETGRMASLIWRTDDAV